MSSKPRRPRQVNTSLLPPQLRMLIRVLGEGPALRLVELRGGTSIDVPARPSAEHWLNDVIGPVAFAALVGEWRNITLQLPKIDSVIRQWRHQRVHELVRQGRTDSQVALATGYSRRHVISIRQAEAEAAGQAAPPGHWPQQFRLLDDDGQPIAVDADGAETGAMAHDPFRLGPRNPRQDV